MLDHDLQMQAKTDDDVGLSGTDLVAAIIRAVPRSVAILVHSANENSRADLGEPTQPSRLLGNPDLNAVPD